MSLFDYYLEKSLAVVFANIPNRKQAELHFIDSDEYIISSEKSTDSD
jgi:hypothetical protein